MTSELADVWRYFADVSLGSYAPLYDRVTRATAEDPELLKLVASADENARMPNNLHAAAQFLLADLPDHPLAAIYRGESDADPAEPFRNLVLTHRDQILELMATRKVQTNEVRRASAIVPSLTLVAQRHNTPVALIDAGSSAGLNLLVDHLHIDYGSASVGPPDSPVQVDAELIGPAPALDGLSIGWRRGFDRSPIDVSDPDQARWLRALVWPDHRDRLVRLSAAIDLFNHHRPELVTAEALDGLSAALRDAPTDMMPVVVTSWVVFYFPPELRAAFNDAIVNANRPVAWLSMEMAGVVEDIDAGDPPDLNTEASLVALVTADGAGSATREALGWTHGHGSWLDWRVGS